MKDDFSPEPEENGQHEAYDNIFIPPPINGSQKKSKGNKYEDRSELLDVAIIGKAIAFTSKL